MKTHIDYTKINKSLIYKERTNLEDFIRANDLNAIIIENMQEIDFLMYEEFELHALACMNEAYYYCTLIMLEKFPMWRWPFFRDSPKKLGRFHKHNYPPAEQSFYEETYQVIVLSIVNILLQHVSEDWQRTQEKFLGKIEDCLKKSYVRRDPQGWLESKNLYSIYEKLSRGTAQEIVLPPTEFSPRYIGDEDIPLDTWVDDIDYTIEAIKRIPTEKAKLHILDKLIKQLKSYIKIDSEDGFYEMSPKYNAALNNLKKLRDNIHLEEASSQILKNQSPMLSNIIAHAEKLPVNGNEVSELKAENTKLRNQVKKLEEENKRLQEDKTAPVSDDNIRLIAENNELLNKISDLKEELREERAKTTDAQLIQQLKNQKEMHEAMIVELLQPAFYGTSDYVLEFLKDIKNLDSQGVTDVVRQRVKDNKILPSKKGRFMWQILKAAKLYDRTEQNWNAALRKEAEDDEE